MKASKRFIFAALPAILLGGCFFPDKPSAHIPVSPDSGPDTTIIPAGIPTSVRIKPHSAFAGEIGTVDLFVYSDTLQAHLREPYREFYELDLEEKKIYTIIAVANAHGSFNDSALLHYDTWESIVYKLCYEHEDSPLMRGKNTCIAGKDAEIDIDPIGSIIQLRSICQTISDCTIIESPRIWLENVSGSAFIFRENTYGSQEWFTTEHLMLNDIGLYTQYPDIRFYVYPNEQPASDSNPPLKLVLEYELNGATRRHEQQIHPILRNTVYPVDITLGPS